MMFPQSRHSVSTIVGFYIRFCFFGTTESNGFEVTRLVRGSYFVLFLSFCYVTRCGVCLVFVFFFNGKKEAHSIVYVRYLVLVFSADGT